MNRSKRSALRAGDPDSNARWTIPQAPAATGVLFFLESPSLGVLEAAISSFTSNTQRLEDSKKHQKTDSWNCQAT